MSAVAAAVDTCAHCGQLMGPEAEGEYCCAGCRAVAEIVRDGGVSTIATDEYRVFDADAFKLEHTRPGPDGTTVVHLVLEGIHCASCLWVIERLPRLVSGVAESRLDMARSSVRVVYDAQRAPLSLIAGTFAKLGYPPRPDRGREREEMRRRSDRALLIRLGVAAACAGNAMMFAIALYAGETYGMDPAITTFLRWATLAVTVPVMLYSADGFFRRAWNALRTRTPHIDVALALSIGAGFVHGIINVVRNSGHIYLDSVATLVFALLASRYLFHKRQRAATEATEALQALTPIVARRCGDDGVVQQVAVAALAVDDVVEVRDGEYVPVDGVVTDGRAAVSESLLNGESTPAAVGRGRFVYAGTKVVDGCMRARATAVGAETRVARLMHTAGQASARRPHVIQLADRLSLLFTVTIIMLSVIAGIVAWPQGLDIALGRAIALLIVACPCALGLAPPLTLAMAMGQAASRRILVKNADAMERLSAAKTVIFDKTGTLTTADMHVAHWFGDQGAQRLVGALEARSKHPVGRALAAFASDACVVSVIEDPGRGLRGVVDGHDVVAGSLRYVATWARGGDEWRAVVDEVARGGATPVAIAVDGVVVGVAGLTAQIHDDARATVAQLQRDGAEVRLLSGDDEHVVARVARDVGISVYEGAASPERKLEVVRELASHSVVAMVGDGVNDAAALAAASVGIAVRGGAEASLAVADMYIDRVGVTAIAQMRDASRRALGTVHIAFVCGVIYNILAVALAIAGLVTPLAAAIIMPASSLTVVTLAYRRRAFREAPLTRAAQRVQTGSVQLRSAS